VIRGHLAKHAENKGGGYQIEPAIEDMSGYMARKCFTIANYMTELSKDCMGRRLRRFPTGAEYRKAA
jgi:hypothetical protein